MSVNVYGINHIAIEVDDIDKAVDFYRDVFNLEKLDEGEGDAFFKIAEHQFLAASNFCRIFAAIRRSVRQSRASRRPARRVASVVAALPRGAGDRVGFRLHALLGSVSAA